MIGAHWFRKHVDQPLTAMYERLDADMAGLPSPQPSRPRPTLRMMLRRPSREHVERSPRRRSAA